MATWTNIPDEVLEPGKPARSVDALALRDNPIAIAEGAAGAPKVTENAMNLNSIHGNRIRTRSIDQSRLVEDNGTRDWVGRRNAALGAGAVGTYAFVVANPNQVISQVNWGSTIAGSNLRPVAVNQAGAPVASGTALSGTWRIMGSSVYNTLTGGGSSRSTLAVRIS